MQRRAQSESEEMAGDSKRRKQEAIQKRVKANRDCSEGEGVCVCVCVCVWAHFDQYHCLMSYGGDL